jgi:LysM repeat protein
VLFKGGTGAGEAARIPAGPKEVVYSAQAGDTPMSVAAAHGLSAAELYALNPGLTPFSHVRRRQVVVGLR